VVPWVDGEIDLPSLQKAVVKGYFYPILCGDLEVLISDNAGELKVSADSLLQICDQIGETFAAEIQPLIKLADWARGQDASTRVRLNPADPKRPAWESRLVPENSCQTSWKDFTLAKC
ncbi:MAG: hypothetical protein ABI882_03880, partial [Acidobacteriota bacterium]